MIDQRSIYIMNGDRPETMVFEGLRRIGFGDVVKPSMWIGLKPNLVVTKPSSSGATTSAGVVEGVVRFLKDHDVRRITIMESSGVGHDTRAAYRVSGIERVARRYGVELIDLKQENTEKIDLGPFQTQVYRKPLEVDYFINLPVVKAHSQTRITCALKNLKGLIPDEAKRSFHTKGLHRPIALLNRVIRQDLIVADGIEGDLSFEEGGNPVRMDQILIARDPVLLDTYVAKRLGYRVEEISHVSEAASLSVGSSDLERVHVVELDRVSKPAKTTVIGNGVRELSKWVNEKDACSVCFGTLLHGLERLRNRGRLGRLTKPLLIGQGYKDRSGKGIGIGQCTQDFSNHLPGCPPTGTEIVQFLEKTIGKG